jgi:UDP-N-acetylglucosamine 4,6-dehydratase/5-epimerase
MLEGNVLITGGSGFLGRAILRKAHQEGWPARFTIYSRDETKQWELKRRYPDVHCILGDVARDLPRLIAAMTGHDLVIHAAAVKYIPEAEHNVLETIAVNIEGSRNVAVAAIAAGVKTVVGISTDKACGPLNLYGMTKAVMERMYSECDRMSPTKFVTVRYGNVVGSTGSVIPIFERQIQDYNEIRVTDGRMTRFWLGVGDAVDLICHAAINAQGGWTVIDPCPAMAIVDLARAVWSIHWQHNGDGRIVFTGMRPGEKLHESLFNDQEAPRVTSVPDSRYYLMAPATHPAAIEGRKGYSSDEPLRWLEIEEMEQLIREAEGI